MGADHLPPRRLVNGVCEDVKPEGCMPPNQLINGVCGLVTPKQCPAGGRHSKIAAAYTLNARSWFAQISRKKL